MRNPLGLSLVLALLAAPALGQQGGLAFPRCGFPSDGRATPPRARKPGDCAYSSTTIKPRYAPEGGIVFEIPVVFHVISNSNGKGNIGAARIHDQIDVINEDFRALAGTPGGLGNDVRVQFYLARVDPNGNATNGIERVSNDTWFQDSGQYWASLAWDTDRYMNVYTNQPGGGTFGYVPDIPQGGLVGSKRDRIVLLFSVVGRNAPAGPPYDQGRTLTHEIGHYLGLDHTFYRGCGAAGACYTDGDNICDTNPEAVEAYGCPVSKSSCGSSDPIRNYMNYSDDICLQEFTPEQSNRMRCTIEFWRPALHTPLCSTAASATVRNAGANPSVLSASAPIAGDALALDLDLAPYTFGTVCGLAGAASVALPGGQVLLVDLGSTRYFESPVLTGASASLSLAVPHDASLCGVAFTAQAVLFGGATPFALTNAVDMVIGSAP